MTGRKGGLAGSAALMFSGTLVSRGLGFARTAVLAVVLLSTGGASTAFAVANSLPNAIYMLLAGGVINAVLVPQLVRAAKDHDGGQEYANRLLTMAGVGLFGVTVLLTLGASLLVQLYGGQMRPEWLPIAYAFAYWCVPQIFFYGLYTLLGQVLNARNVFGPYMWAPAVNNVVAIVGLVIYLMVFGAMPVEQIAAGDFGNDRVLLLAGTATLGVAAQALILIVPLHRSGFRYRPAWGLKGMGGASRMATWTFGALAVGQLGLLAVSNVAAAAENVALRDPGFSADAIPSNFIYQTAFMIFMLPQSLVVVSVMTAIFTRLATKAAAKDGAGVRDDLSLAIRTVGVFTIGAMLVLLVLSVPLARVITLGRPTPEADAALGMTIWALALGIPALAVWSAVQRAYYAYEDARSLFWIQVPMAAVVGLGALSGILWLDPALWVPAAGIWIGLSYALGALVGYLGLRRRLPSLDGSRVLLTHLRLTLAAIPTLALGAGVMRLWGADRGLVVSAVQLVVVGGGMLALYLWLARRLRVTEIDGVTSRLASLARPLTSRLRTMTSARRGGSRGSTSTGEQLVVHTDSVTSGMLLADRFRVGELIPSATPRVRRWSGRDTILERDVEVLSVAGDHTGEILDAARRAALVTDPRLPKMLRVGEFEGTGYVVLEPLGGTPLSEVLAAGPLAPDVARAVAGEIAGALEAGRRRGVHHSALTAASITLTTAGAVRVAGLGVDGAALGTTVGAGAAARADAEAVVALLHQMLGAEGDEPDADRAELLEALPAEIRTTSNLVVALAPWGPVPPAADLLVTAQRPDVDVVAAPAAAAPTISTGAVADRAGEDATSSSDTSPDHVSDEEVVKALEAELIAEAPDTGAMGIPVWNPPLVASSSPPGFDQVLHPDAPATTEPSPPPSPSSSSATAAADDAGSAPTPLPAGGAVTGGGLGEKVRGWLRRLDAVVPAERRGPEPESEAEAKEAFVAPDPAGWTVHPAGDLGSAPATFGEALGDPASESTDASRPTRHSSGAGEGPIAAFATGMLQKVGAGHDTTTANDPDTDTADPGAEPRRDPADEAATEPEDGADVVPAAERDPEPEGALGTHALPHSATSGVVSARIGDEAVAPTPVRGVGRPPFPPVTPAGAADVDGPAAVPGTEGPAAPVPDEPRLARFLPRATAEPRPVKEPRPPKEPRPARQPKARPEPSPRPEPRPKPRPSAPSSSRDADYEVPRKPRGNINATPFVLLIVLAGVVWVLYLALGSLLNAAQVGDAPAPPAQAASTVSVVTVDESPSSVDRTDPASPANLPGGTTTDLIPFQTVGLPHTS